MFDNQVYDQVDGVAMESPLGPVLANIIFCAILKKSGCWITMIAQLSGLDMLIPLPYLQQEHSY